MNGPELLPLIGRWTHILGAAAVFGAILYYWTTVRAATRSGDAAPGSEARDAVMKGLRWIVHGSLLLLLISGLYNYLAVTRHAHGGQSNYHMVFGIKFLIALTVFALAGIAMSSRPGAQHRHESVPLWWGLIAAVVAVILLGGYLKMVPPA